MPSPLKIDRFAESPPCRVLVFTSPKAGSGRGREQIPRLIEQLRQASIPVELIHEARQLRETVSTEVSRQVIVVPAGGDGTLSLAASSVAMAAGVADSQDCSSGLSPLIAPMPLGTENLLARHFGHRTAAEHVLKTIRHGEPYALDVGTANAKPFLIMASCGFDAEVVRAMHLTRSGHIRRTSYFRPIVRAMRRYPFPTLEVTVDEGEPLQCHWAMVFNLPSYGGGLQIEPGAIGNDGWLDVILFRKGSIASGLKYVTAIWTHQHLKLSDVTRCRGRRITIRSTGRVPFQLDGDYVGRLPLQIELQPEAVKLLIPPP